MTQHLVLPQFLKHDVLAGEEGDGRPQILPRFKIKDLADKSVSVGGESTLGVEEAQLIAAMEAVKSLGFTEEQVQMAAKSLIEKTVTDPVVLLQPYVAPADFAAQYPQPLDPTEVLTLCEETAVYQALPEVVTPLNADHWREMDALAMSGDGATNEGFFAKGGCPDTYAHDGDNQTVERKYIGAQKTLSNEDIKHSLAVASIEGLGISAISTQTRRAAVADLKAKEMLLEEILVLNKWDKALVKGDDSVNTLAFDGIETQVTQAAGARVNADPTGHFDANEFDNFLAAGCARATHVFGHPKAIAEIKRAFLQLGAASTAGPIQQIIITKDGNQVVPGFVMADLIDTSIGRLTLIPDFRFNAIQVQPDRFHATVYPLRVYHNGEPIVYKSTQTPLSFKDLTPGCTAISFMIYAVTALVIKHMCAQAAFSANYPGVVGTGCDIICET